MSDSIEIKNLFEDILNVKLKLEAEVLSPQEQEKKHFLLFVDSYKEAVFRSQLLSEQHGIDLWSYEDLYAKSLEGLIYLAFPEPVAELVLWYVYEHSLAEDDSDRTITDKEGNEYLITNSVELYELILKMDIEE
jgi:hypothetical protein